MPKTVTIECAFCGKSVEKSTSEFNRSTRLGRPLFCSRTCSAKAHNAPRKSKEFITTCPHCGKMFKTTTHNKAKKFCSRACASAGSVTNVRREAAVASGVANQANLLPVADLLRRREAWKYVELEESLKLRDHQFEFELGSYVFDLALFDTKTLVEFDGKDHQNTKQKRLDKEKDSVARALGFKVVRRDVTAVTVISPSIIRDL